jgi:hypothetical protein
MHKNDLRHANDASNRRDVADEVEIELLVKRGVDRVGDCGQEQRIAVRGRIHDRLGADVAASARPIFGDERLSEPLGKPLTDQARGDVDPAAGGKADDDTHRPRRIGLPPRYTRYGRKRGSSRGQL